MPPLNDSMVSLMTFAFTIAPSQQERFPRFTAQPFRLALPVIKHSRLPLPPTPFRPSPPSVRPPRPQPKRASRSRREWFELPLEFHHQLERFCFVDNLWFRLPTHGNGPCREHASAESRVSRYSPPPRAAVLPRPRRSRSTRTLPERPVRRLPVGAGSTTTVNPVFKMTATDRTATTCSTRSSYIRTASATQWSRRMTRPPLRPAGPA